MPIDFSSIPEHLRLSIIQKLELRDFAKFSESSLESNSISGKIKTRFTLPTGYWGIEKINDDVVLINCVNGSNRYKIPMDIVNKIPVRIEKGFIGSSDLTEELCEIFTKFLVASKSSNGLQLREVSCSPETFNRFVETAKGCGVINVPKEYLFLPAMKNVDFIQVWYSLSDEEFLALKLPAMFISETYITSNGINFFLKEWLNGERVIEDIEINTVEDIEDEVIFDGIDYSETDSNSSFERIFAIKKDEDHRMEIKFEHRWSAEEMELHLCLKPL